MIKKIIFDEDNTLIEWKDELYWNTAYEAIKDKYMITQEQLLKIKNVINNYELVEEKFDINIMQKMINENLEKEFSNQLIQDILEVFSNCAPEKADEQLISTLEYLSNKYELVVLTNWYVKPQEKRLKKMGILKYFSKVYGAEEFKAKPNPEAYYIAAGENKLEECIMIGDGLKNDVYGPIEVGMQSILFDSSKQNEKNEKYRVINNFGELKTIL